MLFGGMPDSSSNASGTQNSFLYIIACFTKYHANNRGKWTLCLIKPDLSFFFNLPAVDVQYGCHLNILIHIKNAAFKQKQEKYNNWLILFLTKAAGNYLSDVLILHLGWINMKEF